MHLDRALNFYHFGHPWGVPDGFGGHIDERAEVSPLPSRKERRIGQATIQYSIAQNITVQYSSA